MNADGSDECTKPDGRKYHGSTPGPGDPTCTECSTSGTDAASSSGAQGTALSSPVSFCLSDGSTVTLDPDGKMTRAYANGDVVTRFPDGMVKRTTAAGASTTWHPDGSVESRQGDHSQTWDASTGVHVGRTSAATTTHDATWALNEGHLWSDFGSGGGGAPREGPCPPQRAVGRTLSVSGEALLSGAVGTRLHRRGNLLGHGDRAGFLRPCE